MSDAWPWLLLAGLGAFHGLNPAMGWLFAVALGLHRGSMAAVLWALPPLAIGHLLSIGIVAGLAVATGALVDGRWIYAGAGLLLIGWAAWIQFYGHRHRVRIGMTAGFGGLLLWSFLMATAHGAGLMILPALMPLCLAASPVQALGGTQSPMIALAAVLVHTGAMLAVTAAIAIAVYRWIGLGILRSAWLNFDWIWSAALAATGVVLLTNL
ncbi:MULTISPECIES: hypothetical protein [Rhodomicrobium]|uniref:hypothetical protein n=1 Tax=Rhodomicrobium TaxID=1068 RepID=UPI000B4B8482|nr:MULTISPECIES: hypothetical protein [Rhodomicrobium]